MNIIVSSSACDEWSPSWPVAHSFSSSSSVKGSAWRFWAPNPRDCKRFISPSNVERKLANEESLKMSTPGCPFSLIWRKIPQQIWWSVFGGYSVPSFFLPEQTYTSSIVNYCCPVMRLLNLLAHCLRQSSCICSMSSKSPHNIWYQPVSSLEF